MQTSRAPRILKPLALALLGLALAAPLRAYVTSAVLEYTVDDKAAVWLNGSVLMPKSDYAPFDYEAISTSDGTLDMGLFDPFHENTLAVEDYDTEGDHISISYRLTVHISDGDPIVIWSDPSQAKFINLPKTQPDPEGWTRTDFDDSAWKPAVQGTELVFPFFIFPSLEDPSQPSGYVPRLSHNFNLKTNTQDHDLYRSHFRFPNHQAKVSALINPAQAAVGQKVAVRLVPGPDSSDFTQFNVLAWLPKGLDLASAAPGYKWNPALRRLSWSFNRDNLKVGYARLPAQTVMDASGWSQPEKVLGPFKPGKVKRQLNVSDFLFNDGAKFTAHRPAWFKLAPHGVDLRSWRPEILGVIFRSQLRLGGKDTATATDADAVYFNYSIDGSEHEALKRDVKITHGNDNGYWIDGYYDATEDRRWTWEELDRLAVKIEARARGTVSTDRMAAVVATVKYYVPAGASPWFYATVTNPACDTLALATAAFRPGSPIVNSDPVDVHVNAGLCAPTPAPTPTETPVPKALMVIPTPQPPKAAPADANILAGENRFDLGCLAASPDPFNYAGTFISFCVKKDVDVALNVYSADTGKVVRQMKAAPFRAGDNNQIFFNAQDDDGRLLGTGSYLFELVAVKGSHKETRNATFQFVKKGRGE